MCFTTWHPLTLANTKFNRTAKARELNLYAKMGHLNFELKACVFWVPGSQKLAMLGEKTCRFTEPTLIQPSQVVST